MKRIVVTVALTGLLAACGSNAGADNLPTDPWSVSTGYSDAPNDTTPTQDTITYKVFGAPRAASVTMDTNNQESQETGVTLPWRKTIVLDGSETIPIYLVGAQNAGSGSITCQILFDGQVVASQTSSGAYAVVQCSYASQ